MPLSIVVSLSLYCGVSVLGLLMVLFLPIETKGRALKVTNNFVYDIRSYW